MIEKPLRGEALMARRTRRKQHTEREKKTMQAALTRDRHKCRVPNCEYAPMKLPVDPCHESHRGMGGNPKGDRTTRKTVIALCRTHHGLYDHAFIFIDDIDEEAGFDGPCQFRQYNPKTQEITVLGREKNGPHN